MKTILMFFVSLTCITANAQFHKSRAASETSLLTLKTQSLLLPPSGVNDNPALHIPYHLMPAKVTTFAVAMNAQNSSAPPGTPPHLQNYWSGATVTSYSQSGRLKVSQTFDQLGRLNESKTTFNISRKKR